MGWKRAHYPENSLRKRESVFAQVTEKASDLEEAIGCDGELAELPRTMLCSTAMISFFPVSLVFTAT